LRSACNCPGALGKGNNVCCRRQRWMCMALADKGCGGGQNRNGKQRRLKKRFGRILKNLSVIKVEERRRRNTFHVGRIEMSTSRQCHNRLLSCGPSLARPSGPSKTSQYYAFSPIALLPPLTSLESSPLNLPVSPCPPVGTCFPSCT